MSRLKLIAFLTVFLVATSANWTINLLGASAWKWLQYGAYSVYYLVVLHTLYFLFMHYTISFHRQVPNDPNWFRYPFLILALLIPVLQAGAFIKVITQKNKKLKPSPARRRRIGKARV